LKIEIFDEKIFAVQDEHAAILNYILLGKIAFEIE
jgi:hypothetical protein